MRSLILVTTFILAGSASTIALGDEDMCQQLRDQYSQNCQSPMTNNKTAAWIIAGACTTELIAIQNCERDAQQTANQSSPDNGSGNDNSN